MTPNPSFKVTVYLQVKGLSASAELLVWVAFLLLALNFAVKLHLQYFVHIILYCDVNVVYVFVNFMPYIF